MGVRGRGDVVRSVEDDVTGFVVNDSAAGQFLIVPIEKDAALKPMWVSSDTTRTKSVRRTDKVLREIVNLPASGVGREMSEALARTAECTEDWKVLWDRVGYLFFGPNWKRQIGSTPIHPWTEQADWLK